MERTGRTIYKLVLTRKEVHIMFEGMVRDWFSESDYYNDFIKALLLGDVTAMNTYMNRVTREMFSYFDTGKNREGEPERFYHGFVLGLVVELSDQYLVTSNRESGFGRYDVMLEPRDASRNDAIILEFKVQDAKEKSYPKLCPKLRDRSRRKTTLHLWWRKEFPKNVFESMALLFAGKKY